MKYVTDAGLVTMYNTQQTLAKVVYCNVYWNKSIHKLGEYFIKRWDVLMYKASFSDMLSVATLLIF